MSWLKRQQPIELYQSSELPYVILEDGVHLCYDNCFGNRPGNEDFNLKFRVEAGRLKRINTYFYRFSTFPYVIPFHEVISLNDAVIEGKTIKHYASSEGESQNVAIMKSEYIRNYAGSDLSDISDVLEDYDKSFILVDEGIDPQVRLFEEFATILPHQEWTRTFVSIAHQVAERPERKYCWTKSVPDVNLSVYGISSSDELKDIHNSVEQIGITDFSIRWED